MKTKLILTVLIAFQCGLVFATAEPNQAPAQQASKFSAWCRKKAAALRNAMCCRGSWVAELECDSQLEQALNIRKPCEFTRDLDEDSYDEIDRFNDELNDLIRVFGSLENAERLIPQERIQREKERIQQEARLLALKRKQEQKYLRWRAKVGRSTPDSIQKYVAFKKMEEVFAAINHPRCGKNSAGCELPADVVQHIVNYLRPVMKVQKLYKCYFEGCDFDTDEYDELCDHMDASGHALCTEVFAQFA